MSSNLRFEKESLDHISYNRITELGIEQGLGGLVIEI